MKKIRVLYLLFLLIHFTSCQERSSFVGDDLPEGESVAVSLAVDIDGEEEGTQLQPQTRAGYTVPDALYELHILQFDSNDNQLDANGSASGKVFYMSRANLGSHLALSLTKNDDCQLVIIARGEGNTSPAIDGNLATVRKLSMDQSLFNTDNIPVSGATQAQINKMPYVLHLSHVKVDESGVVQSTVNGTEDVRLYLKRLAVKLTATWTYSVRDYNLKQVLLQSVPLNFSFIPAPDEADGTYPSLLEQFTTISIPAVTNSGTYSLWIPANVRGESASATSLKLRTRSTAPTGSCFLNFIAVNSTDSKKKLDYRVYLGDDKPTDFNLKSNTDYNYVIDFNHFGIPTDDQRVTYIDPIPASEGNDNLVPTANCFMVAPGGSFCFDPFMFRQNGTDIENTTLTGWSTQIRSVKLLWQTKENGDVGDPVIGIVNSVDDHTNIVDIKNTDGTSAPYVKGKARIYCRVASNTTGGSGVIAAYDGDNGTGNILWSWHIWVTDYNPDSKGDETVLTPASKRKLKYTYSSVPRNSLPMMDRNLGAIEGYVDAVPENVLAMSKANGFHYQWGRKDPFISSYSAEAINEVNNVISETPPKGLLNRYGPDGIQYVKNKSTVITTERDLFKKPDTFSSDYRSSSWIKTNLWNESGNKKTCYDPCPAGWTVIGYEDLYSVFGSGTANPDNTANDKLKDPNIANESTIGRDGGVSVYFQAKGSGHTCYYRLTGYWRFEDSFQYIGQQFNIWTRRWKSANLSTAFIFIFNDETSQITGFTLKTRDVQDAHPTRCIQERAD